MRIQSRSISVMLVLSLLHFLLAWWNAGTCGKFDPTDLWGLDMSLRVDVLRIVAFISMDHRYPDSLGYGPQFERLVAAWRPHLVASTAQ